MFNKLDEAKFKRIAMWSIYTMLFCQAFPLLYFRYDFGHPITQRFWIVGLAFPAVISLIGIAKPELVARTMLEDDPGRPEIIVRRGREYSLITFVLFCGAIILLLLT